MNTGISGVCCGAPRRFEAQGHEDQNDEDKDWRINPLGVVFGTVRNRRIRRRR